jgi:hypothetical protein
LLSVPRSGVPFRERGYLLSPAALATLAHFSILALDQLREILGRSAKRIDPRIAQHRTALRAS